METRKLARRELLRALAIIWSTSVAVSLGLGGFMKVAAQQSQPGMPQPDEKVDATITRQFGNRSCQSPPRPPPAERAADGRRAAAQRGCS